MIIINELEKKSSFRVGIYLRLSDEDRDKLNKTDDSESIKNQRNLLLEEIAKRPEFVLVDEYCDEDLSGAGTYRPEFDRMIQDCENGKLDIVLAKSQSRFSRDMEIIEKYLHNKFLEWNVRFISFSDHADTANAGNKKARQINGLVNEWYLEDVSNNIRSAFYSKMKHGEFISPFACFGYEIDKNNNNRLVVDPVAAQVVKEIFHLYLTGMGVTGIAKDLNKRHIPSPSLYKYQRGIKLNIVSKRPVTEILWSANAIKTILSNEIYLGHLIQGKRTTTSYKNKKIRKKDQTEWIRYENTHQGIVDEETFRKAEKIRKERTRTCKRTNRVHLFSGKVYCMNCLHLMKKKNSSRHVYLVCPSKSNGYSNCENQKGFRYDTLESIILKAINEKIRKYFDFEYLKQEIDKIIHNTYEVDFELLKKKKDDVEKQILNKQNYLKSVYEDKINGCITPLLFQELSFSFEEDLKIMLEEEKQLEKEIKSFDKKKEMNSNYHHFLQKYQTFSNLNSFIVNEFIDKIYISKVENNDSSRKIQIVWNFHQ